MIKTTLTQDERDNVLVVIPARLESKRLPYKMMLLAKTGKHGEPKPLICHTVEAVKRAGYENVIVVTSSDKIIGAISEYSGVACVDTGPGEEKTKFKNGTERVAWALKFLGYDDWPQRCDRIVCIVQGDEVAITQEVIDAAVGGLMPGIDVNTVAAKTGEDESRLHHTGDVFVAFGSGGKALYFSRSRIPSGSAGGAVLHRHVGVYAATATQLLLYPELQWTDLELAEKLEQLRWLYWDYSVGLSIVKHAPRGINHFGDYLEYVDEMESR